jgi:hypothetical protein
LFQDCEARGFDGEVILRGRQLEELVISLTITLGSAGESGGGIANGHGRMWQHGALGIVDRSAQGSGCCLRQEQSAEGEEKPKP